MYLSSEKRRVTLVVYLPLSGAVEVPEIVSEELVFVRACLLHLDSAANRDLSADLRQIRVNSGYRTRHVVGRRL